VDLTDGKVAAGLPPRLRDDCGALNKIGVQNRFPPSQIRDSLRESGARPAQPCARSGRIGNAVQIRNVPNAVRWMALQDATGQQAGKAQLPLKPSQKTGQMQPDRPLVNGGS